MKKLVLAGASIAALTIASPAMAQSASPDPAADTPAECPIGANNCSIITQSGAENDANVLQDGDGNVSVVDQTGTHADPGNNVDVDQTGDDNFSFVTQDTSATNTVPVSATVLQEGINSLAEIDQIGNAAGGTATIQQDSLTDFSFAEIEQTGAAGGAANTATIDQDGGFLNSAAIVQGRTTTFDGSPFTPAGVETNSTGGSATIDQIGDFNQGSIIQGGSTQTATITQDSEVAPMLGNLALTIQGSFGGSSLNRAFTDQTGDGNSSEIYQNDTTTGGNNLADVDQFGSDGNFSRITQNGSDHSATVTQYDGSASIISQSGTGNTTTVTQGTP